MTPGNTKNPKIKNTITLPSFINFEIIPSTRYSTLNPIYSLNNNLS